jgi:regulator of protease activity HflC (stomatin/prohibitin superfamily)
MTDLTEKILSLDLQSALALQDAKALSAAAKKKADKDKDHKIKEVQKLFEEDKKSETKLHAKRFEEERKKARLNLDQKMKTFDEGLNIDAVIDELVKVTKEGICL